MFEGLFDLGIPIVIVLFFIYFLWGWILMNVKPPKETEGNRTPVKHDPRWNHLEATSGAIRNRVTQKVESKRKAA